MILRKRAVIMYKVDKVVLSFNTKINKHLSIHCVTVS